MLLKFFNIIKFQFKKKLSHSDTPLKRYKENTKWKKIFLKNFAKNSWLFISILKLYSYI
jgi:hypothetical protein